MLSHTLGHVSHLKLFLIVLPSFAFFLLTKVPPSFPRKVSSFFLKLGESGVGEDGDFCGEDAIIRQCLLKQTNQQYSIINTKGFNFSTASCWTCEKSLERKRNSRYLALPSERWILPVFLLPYQTSPNGFTRLVFATPTFPKSVSRSRIRRVSLKPVFSGIGSPLILAVTP